MKIAVSSFGTNLEATVDSRFGRCPYFVIVDSDNMQVEAVPNVSQSTTSGAGIQAAQTIANKGVKALLTGNIGPNAYQALSTAGVKIVTGVSGTVIEAITKYKKGELKESNSPTVSGHIGFGKGQGMGRGRRRN